MPDSPFRTWTDREPYGLHPGISLHAIGGDQLLLCRVTYEPGARVKRHAHEHSEQLMAVVEGDLTMTIGSETRTLGPGDVVCVNKGVEHELNSQHGVTFFEALSPVTLDHVGDPERDLVLGADEGRLHVER
jgi:quercetin dioxygenase-like cupin family protein